MNRFKMTGSANSMVHGFTSNLETKTNYFGYSEEFEKLSRKADHAQRSIPKNRGMKPKA